MLELIKRWISWSASKVAAKTAPPPPATYTHLRSALMVHYRQRHRPAEEYVIVQRTTLQALIVLTWMRLVDSGKAEVLRQRLRALLLGKVSTAMFDHDADVEALKEIERLAGSLGLLAHKSLAAFALSTSVEEVIQKAKGIR